VIVVGNVVAGGAGKTPLTIAVVKHLQQQGWKAGVISRGHGRRLDDIRAVLPDSFPTEVGDEPLLIHQKTGAPVWVANLRAEAGLALLQAHPEVNILVCDDGLQHWALARDMDICVMDERGVGNGWLLPAGPLREPWPRSVDLLLHTGPNDLPGGFRAQRQLGPLAHDAHGRSLALSSLIGQPVDAVAGLARPEAFFAMLRAVGLQLNQTTALPDHFDYADGSPTHSDRLLLCTEKDAAKGSVLVVGDGINDAPALAAADVGIAMGAKGTTAASQAASVVIVEDSIRRLANAIDISQVARTRAIQASTIGMSLAIVAMLAAAFGYLSPSQAALVQELIDAASIIWALVGRRRKIN
jgi:tetraacyldisaccharide 4'-kinase